MKEKEKKIHKGLIVNIALIIIIGLALGYGIGIRLQKQDRGSAKGVETLSPEKVPEAPKDDVPIEQKAAFAQKVKELAKEVDHMEVGENCALSPEIARIREGASFSFVNKSSGEHQIRIATKDLIIPPGGKGVIIGQFEYGLGVYGIACDMQEKGFLEVIVK